MIRAVVFDLDGTLVDSLADIAGAVNATLVRWGRAPQSAAAYRAIVGWGLKQTLSSAAASRPFSEEELERAFGDVIEAYRASPVVSTAAYSGVASLLAGLSGRVKLGVLSNKEDAMTKTIVETLFPGVFDSVAGAKIGVPHKPNPQSLLEMLSVWGVQSQECAFLGDSGVDMQTAKNALCAACGASWGFRDETELRASGADILFPDAEAFRTWILPRLEQPRQSRATNRN